MNLKLVHNIETDEKTKEALLKIVDQNENYNAEVKKLHAQLSMSQLEVQNLGKKLESFEKSKHTIKFCVRCKEQYTTGNNKEVEKIDTWLT